MSWKAYVLKCSDGSPYISTTNDLERQLTKIADGKGPKYTRSRLPVTIIHVVEYPHRRTSYKAARAYKTVLCTILRGNLTCNDIDEGEIIFLLRRAEIRSIAETGLRNMALSHQRVCPLGPGELVEIKLEVDSAPDKPKALIGWVHSHEGNEQCHWDTHLLL
jgi:putative endonuclease